MKPTQREHCSTFNTMEKRNVKRQKKEQNPDLNKKKNGSKKIGT